MLISSAANTPAGAWGRGEAPAPWRCQALWIRPEGLAFLLVLAKTEGVKPLRPAQPLPEPSPYRERIAQLRHELAVLQRQLREQGGDGVLGDRLLERMRPLYDDLVALYAEIEVQQPRQV